MKNTANDEILNYLKACKESDCGVHMDDPFNISDSDSARKLSCGETVLNYQCDSCTPYNSLCSYQIVFFFYLKKNSQVFFGKRIMRKAVP